MNFHYNYIIRPAKYGVNNLLILGLCHNGDPQLLQLLGRNLGGTVAHQLGGILHLGEGNHVTQVLKTQKLHHQAVQTNAHTAVGRGTVLECIGKEAELAPPREKDPAY